MMIIRNQIRRINSNEKMGCRVLDTAVHVDSFILTPSNDEKGKIRRKEWKHDVNDEGLCHCYLCLEKLC